jgi:transketolase N-terminal domain/subunit
MDEKGIKLLRGIAFGFALAQIAGRMPVVNSDGKINEGSRREAWAIVDEMTSLIPKEPA